MELYIDVRSTSPIYDQIYAQLKGQIIAGNLVEHQALPSIRGLAKELHISVITTKRAYDELEKEGLIYTVAGKGCFVAPKNPELLRQDTLRQIEEHMEQIHRLAVLGQVSRRELAEMYDLLGEEKE